MKNGWKIIAYAHGNDAQESGPFKTLKAAKDQLELLIGAEVAQNFKYAPGCYEFNHQHIIEKV